MVKNIVAEYGINLKQSSEDAAHTAAEGTIVGSSVVLGGNIAVQEAVGKLSEEAAKNAVGWIPLLGNAVNGSVAGVTTNGLGKRIIKI